MPLNGGLMQQPRVVVNAPERVGELAQKHQKQNPAFQSNSKVGSRRRVEDGKAQYTWRNKSKAGLTDENIQPEIISGWRGEFNRNNILSIQSDPFSRQDQAVIKVRNNNPKRKYKSILASESAKTKNNWIIYVRLALFYYNRIANTQKAATVKYPQLISDPILQAMFHARDDDGHDCPVPPDHYILFADCTARFNFEMMMNTIRSAAIANGNRQLNVKLDNPFDMSSPPMDGQAMNFRDMINSQWDSLFTNVAFAAILPPTQNLHYWPFRYANNVADPTLVRYGVTLAVYNRDYRPPPGSTIIHNPRLLDLPTLDDNFDFGDFGFIDVSERLSGISSNSSRSRASSKNVTGFDDINNLDDDSLNAYYDLPFFDSEPTSDLIPENPPSKKIAKTPRKTPRNTRISELSINDADEDETEVSLFVKNLMDRYDSLRQEISDLIVYHLSTLEVDDPRQKLLREYTDQLDSSKPTSNIERDVNDLDRLLRNINQNFKLAPSDSPLSNLSLASPPSTLPELDRKKTNFQKHYSKSLSKLKNKSIFTDYMEELFQQQMTVLDAQRLDTTLKEQTFFENDNSMQRDQLEVIFYDGHEIVKSRAREYIRTWSNENQEKVMKKLADIASNKGLVKINTGFAPSLLWGAVKDVKESENQAEMRERLKTFVELNDFDFLIFMRMALPNQASQQLDAMVSSFIASPNTSNEVDALVSSSSTPFKPSSNSPLFSDVEDSPLNVMKPERLFSTKNESIAQPPPNETRAFFENFLNTKTTSQKPTKKKTAPRKKQSRGQSLLETIIQEIDESPPAKITRSGRVSKRSQIYSNTRGGVYGTELKK